jgi:succinyl-CoA synthetase beta subunit
VAQGIVQAATEERVPVPIVARLAGTNVTQGRRILEESGLHIITASDLADAASKAVAALGASAQIGGTVTRGAA